MDLAREAARESTRLAAAALEEDLRPVMAMTQGLARLAASTTPADREALFERLKGVVESDSFVIEAGAAYSPEYLKGAERRDAPHFGLHDGEYSRFQVEASYDYANYEWYQEGMKSAGWFDPYYGRATRSWVTGYVAPVIAPGAALGDSPIGVVRVNYSMAGVQKILARLPLGSGGYAFLLSKSGRFVHHPIDEYIRGRKTIRDIAAEANDSNLNLLSESALTGRSGEMAFQDNATGQSDWVFFEPVAASGWTLATVFVQDEILKSDRTDRQKRIALFFLAIGSVVFFLLSVLVRTEMTPKRLWAAAAIISVSFLAAMLFIWFVTLTAAFHEESLAHRIGDRAALHRFLDERTTRSIEEFGEPPIYVPTGVFVQSIEIKNTSDVLVTGLIWQKYGSEIPSDVIRGVELSDAVENEIEEIYRRKDGGVEHIGWKFRSTIRQQFEYSQFPLDHQNLRIRLARKNFDRDVILIPDLDAYDVLIPTMLPGIERALIINGWKLEASFFDYFLTGYNSDFGIKRFVGQEGYPLLAFNVILRRQFLAPFISNIFPLFLIAGIGFMLLMMVGADKEIIAAYDARGARTTSVATSLFFAVLLAHIRLRNELAGLGSTIYLEYFFFAMYGVVMWIVLSAYLILAQRPLGFFGARGNIWPKLIYWPILTGMVLANTLLFFF